MKRIADPPKLQETTLLALVAAVSEHARNDAETIQVVGHLLRTRGFQVADGPRFDRLRRRVAGLPATH